MRHNVGRNASIMMIFCGIMMIFSGKMIISGSSSVMFLFRKPLD